MVPIHWSIPTSMIKNKSSYFKEIWNFMLLPSWYFSSPTSPLETTVQLHVIFLLRIPGSRVVLLGNGITIKRQPPYLVMERPLWGIAFFKNTKNTESLKGKSVRELGIFCREYPHITWWNFMQEQGSGTTISWWTVAYGKQLG